MPAEESPPPRPLAFRCAAPALPAFARLVIGVASALLAAGIATLAQVHGTVSPAMILLALNLVPVAAASRVPRTPVRSTRAAPAGCGRASAAARSRIPVGGSAGGRR